jgi:eukaryotic-like serine/threonine-protein kinase
LDSTTDLSKSRLFSVQGGTLIVADLSAGDFTEKERLTAGIVDKKYQILAPLGKGGMGAVYRARHLMLNKDVALKTFRTTTLAKDACLRFQREAQAIAKINHKYVVQIFDFGLFEDGAPYYTMEFLLGQSLAERIRKNGALTIEQSIALFMQTCQGLSEAHSKGIIHRDLKPGNLFIESSLSPKGKLDNIKIVDFGIASLIDQSLEEQKLTANGTICGSPLYMSPEHSMGQTVTERSDIYSLGCSLFEALTGNPPFRGATALDTIMLHHNANPPSLKASSGGKDYPLALERTVATMLAKSPDDRPASIDQVAAQLSQFGPDLRRVVSRTSPPDKPTRPSSDLTGSYEDSEKDKIPLRISPKLPLILTVVAALLVIGLGWIGYLSSSGPTKNTSAVPAQKGINVGNATKAPDNVGKQISAQTASTQILVPTGTTEQGQNGRETLVFNFPGEVDFGTFISPQFAEKLVTARGRVSWEASIRPTFRPTSEFLQNPDNLGIFQPNYLGGLDLSRCPREQKDSRLMRQIGRLTGLRVLNLTESDITDHDLNELKKLTHLQSLNLSSTNITGKALATLPQLKQLNNLRFNRCQGTSDLLAALKGSQCLNELVLDGDYLTDADFKLIGTMSELQTLHVDDTSMSDDDLIPLTSLTKLKTLKSQKSKITAKAIETLKILRANGLRKLDVSVNKLSWADNEKIKMLIPEAEIVNDEFTMDSLPSSAWKGLDR